MKLTAAWAASHDLRHAFAMTLHKAQGLTVDHALLYGGETLTGEAGYVGLSRGRRENHIYTTSTDFRPRTDECALDGLHPLADDAVSRGRTANHLYVTDCLDVASRAINEEQQLDRLADRLAVRSTQTLASRQLPRLQPSRWRQPVTEYSTRDRNEGISR